MRKQTNQKPSYKYGEKIRTKNILGRLRRKGNPNEYLRMKYFLKLANAIGNANLGYVPYVKTLSIVENAKDSFILSLKTGFGYPLEGETIDELTEKDLRQLDMHRIFIVPAMAFIKIDTREIQKIISAIPEYQLQRDSGSLGYLYQ
jgi:hypothetical protein